MALIDIVNTLLPSFAVDTVAVFNGDYEQLFVNARAIKAVVKEQSEVMEHPIETGAIITDHRIILPTQIELTLILASSDYRETYQNIKQYYLNAELLTIQTKADTYNNQVIESMPHEEDPEQYNIIPLILNLKQVLFVEAQYTTLPKQPKDSSTVNRGVQQTAPVNEKEASTTLLAVRGIKDTLKGWLGI